MRRTGRSALAQGALALAVIAAGAVVVVTDDSTAIADAETQLGVVRNAQIVSASGTTRPATFGAALLPGDLITTGPHGSAEVVTKRRTTLLGSRAALAVVNGGRQQLRTGTAVVDALSGPGLDLDLSGVVVGIPHGSATEAARGVSVRIGALSGPAALTGTTGRRLALPPLSQAVLSGDALPGGTTPLHLTDSRHESSVVPALVRDDVALKALARGIDSTGNSTARVVQSAWSGTTQPVPGRAHRSERVLPMLIADSTRGGTPQQRYDNAVAWRAEGGSWGVVLHLLSGRATAVEATLASLQRAGQEPGQIGTVPSTVVAAGPSGPAAFQTPPPPKVGAGHQPPSVPPAPPSGGGSPSSSPAPPNLLGGLVSTVQSVIDGVFGLLPHDKATADTATTTTHVTAQPSTHKALTKSAPLPTRSKVPAKKAPVKIPTVTSTPTPSNGLLGNLLGGLLGQH
ncbi:MAG TPA: hypothetical protein VHE57_00655 [Mycobacteriales bacterium]|nr:hypothetical protein [Mycobacteriales bacterium]